MFHLSTDVIDPAALHRQLARPGAGALVTFEGRVRNENEGHKVDRLEYEAAEKMAVAEGRKIIEEAATRFAILDALCVHRIGRLEPGELAVWVGVLAAHRSAAFDACRFIIDELKSRVPIWKKEHYASGEATWINAE
jgi:molybdopterin synthase catalytic subunit